MGGKKNSPKRSVTDLLRYCAPTLDSDDYSIMEMEDDELEDAFMEAVYPEYCSQCDKRLDLGVYHTDAGYYVGTECDCGPFSRDTPYFIRQGDAEIVLRELTGETIH